MKKRLLSALLALALVFVLLPTTALAKVVKSDEDISIAGIDWKFESDSEVGYFYNGKFTTDEPNSSYLKLTKNSNTITITVYGNVTVSDISVHNNFSTQDKINLIITGNKRSTLTLDCRGTYGAALETFQSGDITIKGGITVNANFSANNTNNNTNCYGISASKNLIITDSGTIVNAVNADHNAAAVKVDGNITVSGGAQLNATNKYYGNNNKDKAYAIECGQLSISGDKTQVTAYTGQGKKAINGTVNNGTANDDYKLTFKAGMYKGAPSFNYPKPMDEALGCAYVEITQAPTTSDVRIANEPAIIGQETPIPGGSGTYHYKDDGYNGSILTLKDVNITSGTNAIQFTAAGTYTVKLEGTNEMSGVGKGILAANVAKDAINVIISGSGSLDISANGRAIEVTNGYLTFNNTGAINLKTTNTANNNINAINASGKISIGSDFNKNLKITADNGAATFDPTIPYTDYNDLKNYKSISFSLKDSTIRYDGKTLKQGETINGENGGTATVAPNGNTITLNNFKGTQALSFEATLADSTLVLEGTNTLSSIVTTQKGLTISGSGSLTVGSIRVTNNDNIRANLTITDGAIVIAKSNATRAIDVNGSLTVTGASLTATSTSDSVPTVQVGGNASFTGSTVTITNNSTTQGKSGEYSYAVSTGLYVGGTLDIKNAAKVTSTVIGGNAIYAKGDITISGDGTKVEAQNSAYKFSAISTNETVNISDNSTVKAENLKKHQGDGTGKTDPSTGKTYNACPAITGKIANKNTQNKLHIAGFTTSNPGSNPKEGVVLNFDINPSSAERYILHYDVTITRGDEVTRTNSPVVIAGTTLLNDTPYTITNGSTVAVGTDESNYNAFYDSTTKTLKLNNASINGAGSNKAIEANVGGNTLTIELVGNNIVKTSDFANNVIDITGNLYFTGSGTAEISGKGTPIYATYKIDVSADVTITNTEKAGSFTFSPYGENYKGANTFAIGAGYTAYATTDKTTWAVYDNTTASENENYTTLRITKENLAPTTPTPQKPFTIYGIPAQFVDGGMIATTGVTATSSNNINLPIDRVKWYTFTPVFGSDGRMDSVSDKTEATGNFEAGKYYVVEIKFVQDLSPFKSWDMKVSGWSDNGVYRQSETARNDIEIYFLTPVSAATHEHNWVEKYDTVYHWKMCTYDGCTAIKDKALHVWDAWHTSSNERQHWKSCSECSYSTPQHDIDLAYVSDGEQGHHLYCKHDGCTFATGTTAHVYAEGSNICTDCGYNKSAPCDHTGDRAYTNNGDGTHKVTCKACGATIVEKQSHEFGPTGACIYCGATQSGGDPTPDNPGTIVIIRPAEEEKPAQQPNPSTGANDLVGMAVAAAVVAVLGSVALLRKHD